MSGAFGPSSQNFGTTPSRRCFELMLRRNRTILSHQRDDAFGPSSGPLYALSPSSRLQTKVVRSCQCRCGCLMMQEGQSSPGRKNWCVCPIAHLAMLCLGQPICGGLQASTRQKSQWSSGRRLVELSSMPIGLTPFIRRISSDTTLSVFTLILPTNAQIQTAVCTQAVGFGRRTAASVRICLRSIENASVLAHGMPRQRQQGGRGMRSAGIWLRCRLPGSILGSSHAAPFAPPVRLDFILDTLVLRHPVTEFRGTKSEMW